MYDIKTVTVHEHGVRCTECSCGWYKLNERAKAAIGQPCDSGKCKGTFREYDEDRQEIERVMICCGCERPETECDVEERDSLGIYAGTYCSACWEKSGYRKEGPEGFHPEDVGEAYEAADY